MKVFAATLELTVPAHSLTNSCHYADKIGHITKSGGEPLFWMPMIGWFTTGGMLSFVCY